MDLGNVVGYEIAHFLARFFGLLFIVMSLLVLIRRNESAYLIELMKAAS